MSSKCDCIKDGVFIEMITTRLIQFNYSLHAFGFGALSKITLHQNAPNIPSQNTKTPPRTSILRRGSYFMVKM